MSEKKVHIITLGCPKNEVDSEVLAAQLKANGHSIVHSPGEAEVAVINTCGFIDAAKRESIETMLQVAQHKSRGKLKKVVVTGCLVERYRNELKAGLKEIDAFYGTGELKELLNELGAEYKFEMVADRELSTPSHYAYLKISEGCDNPCSFCAIPLMRGKHVSKPIELVIREAELLAAKGVKELIVVAQDTTYYGLDIYGRRELPKLMEKLADIKGVEWIRLMYAYPAKFPEAVLDVMRDNDKICKYIDIPIQHISDNMLKSMRRGITRRKLEELLNMIREKVPGVAIRSTLIVGYPGETEKEFDELYQFVNEFKFDRLGAFTYSLEDGTASSALGDPVPQDEKGRRQALITEAQRQIIAELNDKKTGQKTTVLIDRKDEKNFIGRTSQDAPEIDSEVIITSRKPVEIGTFAVITIDEGYEHDLYGTVI
ncbi:MAG: 30S ribosomal protein S12 methylthiotransferase RimO [Bacteroidetes bacterium]|nr:30S ribosomal protein S12 methylthiotransferase RimO [Bacteroidota bacterium]